MRHRRRIALAAFALAGAASALALGIGLFGVHPATVTSYRVVNPQVITVTTLLRPDQSVLTYWASEDRDAVRVTVIARGAGQGLLVGVPHELTVHLRAPLAGRAVINAVDGARVSGGG